MTKHRKRALIGAYNYMKDNTAIMDVLTAVYRGTADEDATPIYSIIRRRTPGSKLHTFREDYPVVDPTLIIYTYSTQQAQEISMELDHATDVIDEEMEAARISYDGLEFVLQGLADGNREPNETTGDSNLLYTSLTYRYQIQ